MSHAPVLAVLPLSDSFATLWSEVAEELDAELVRLEAGAGTPPNTVALILAAGGEEQQALDLLSRERARWAAPVFVVAGSPAHRLAVEAVRAGAADYFVLPDEVDAFRRALAARVDGGRERARRSGEESRPDPFATLVGRSAALQDALDQARRVLPHRDVTILIGGETGTGKELLARALHEGGPRAAGPFVAVNCAAIPAQLLESELFGHERGAFTDAHQSKPGLFEEADRGTLFLDEIGHLPLPLQGKLLRALEDRAIRRVGSTQARTVDVRIVAATHVTLADAVAAGDFREDLYYRLNVVSLTLPPLRERGEDVLLLAGTFLDQLAARYGLERPALTTVMRDALMSRSWPGNVRELRHALERALLLSPPGQLDPDRLGAERAAADGGRHPLPFPASMDAIERAAAVAAVERQAGNKSAAARQLGISRTRLQRLLDEAEDHRADSA